MEALELYEAGLEAAARDEQDSVAAISRSQARRQKVIEAQA